VPGPRAARRGRTGRVGSGRSNVIRVIPLPRAWLLTSAMLIGTTVGMVAAIASMLLVTAHIRPDVVIALVLGVPSAVGMLLILLSGRRWVTTLGAFMIAVAPGWFGVLVAIQVVSGA
jgi:putative holin